MNILKKQFYRAQIVESLRELTQKTRRNSTSFYAEAIQNLQLSIEADRILGEIYG
jgi:hypothetical protein